MRYGKTKLSDGVVIFFVFMLTLTAGSFYALLAEINGWKFPTIEMSEPEPKKKDKRNGKRR